MSGPMFANLRRTPDRDSALKRRFWVAVALGGLISALGVLHGSAGGHVYTGTWIAWLRWLELALAAIAAFWCGWPLLGPLSAHAPSGPSLVALIGVAAFGYGLLALVAPELWPREWRNVYELSAWSYARAMPLVSGIGLSPLLQWFIVPIAVLFAYRRISARRKQAHG